MGRLLSGLSQAAIKDVVVPPFPVDAILVSTTSDTCSGTEMMYSIYNSNCVKIYNIILHLQLQIPAQLHIIVVLYKLWLTIYIVSIVTIVLKAYIIWQNIVTVDM